MPSIYHNPIVLKEIRRLLYIYRVTDLYSISSIDWSTLTDDQKVNMWQTQIELLQHIYELLDIPDPYRHYYLDDTME